MHRGIKLRFIRYIEWWGETESGETFCRSQKRPNHVTGFSDDTLEYSKMKKVNRIKSMVKSKGGIKIIRDTFVWIRTGRETKSSKSLDFFQLMGLISHSVSWLLSYLSGACGWFIEKYHFKLISRSVFSVTRFTYDIIKYLEWPYPSMTGH